MAGAQADCPECGTALDLLDSRTFTDPGALTVDKIVFDGTPRWVEFEKELVYRELYCPACDCDLRQVEWDGEREPPMIDPTCEPDG